MNRAVGSERPGLSITRRAENSTGELSFAQERVWLHQQIQPSSITYNRPTNIRLKGALDVALLRLALDQVVGRHESLRSSVDFVEGNPCYVANQAAPSEMPMLDLRGDAAPEERAQTLAQEEAVLPFDLSRGSLLRARLLRLGEEEYLLVLTIHHFTFDAWSEGVLLDELSSHYGALRRGDTTIKEALPIQCADFAAWDRSVGRIAELEPGRSYWRAALIDPPVLELRTDHLRPHELSEESSSLEFELSDELLARLRGLAKREEATLFSLLLSAFFALLHRYTDEEDMIVGCPVAGRTREELEPLIGIFINMLPLRAEVRARDPFLSLLSRVKESVLKGLEHQEVPLQFMVQDVLSERDLGSSPLFQTMFIHERMPREPREAASVWFESEDVPSVGTMVDLIMEISESKTRVTGRLKYRQELWDAATIERMAGHFLTLLKALVADPGMRIGRLPLLTEAERHKILVEWNDTAVEYPNKCVHELFEEQVARTPDAIALVFEDQELTYSELDERANHLAHHLRGLGVKPETLVGVCMERSFELIVGILGVLKAGGAYLPLEPSLPSSRLNYMLKDSGCRLLVTLEHLGGLFDQNDVRLVLLGDENSKGNTELVTSATEVAVDADNLVYVIYTSGSTGNPKGVETLHRGLSNYVNWCCHSLLDDTVQGKCTNRSLLHTSIGVDLTVTSLWPMLCRGGTVILAPERGIGGVSEFLAGQESPGLLKMTPTHLSVFDPDKMGVWDRYAGPFVIGGEELLAEQLRPWWDRFRGLRILNHYGPTETTVGSCTYEVPFELTSGGVPIGRPIANTRVYVLNESLEPVPVGVAGELFIGGAGLARGYVNRPELTAEKFIPNPFDPKPGARLYRTGDLCRWLADGNLEFLGRLDNQVKLRGFRIELGEIELVLNRHACVSQSVAVLREDYPGDKRLVTYFVPASGLKVNREDLRSHVQGELPDYMVPSAFMELSELPLTVSGKINRRELPRPELDRTLTVGEYTAPRTPLEVELAAIWKEILGLEQVGIHDNFFDLGGHSLLATRLMSKIRKELDVELPLRILFDSPTIELLGLAILDIEMSHLEAIF